MRALFIMYGAPGTGKSSLIDVLGVQDLALGYDNFRELFSAQFPCVYEDGTTGSSFRITAQANREIVAATLNAVEARMAAGTTVFFDATSAHSADQTKLAALGRKYGYTSYVIDCQGGTPLEHLLSRNRFRGQDRVDETALIRINETCANKVFSKNIKAVIDGTNVESAREAIAKITATPILNIPEGGEAIVVGDVHSCAETLDQIVAEKNNPNVHWVFAGDLFDRGPDPIGVWKTVQKLISEGRATIITGNHELNLRAINKNTARAPFTDTRVTRDALLSIGVMSAEQTDFVDATVPAVLINVSDQQWIVTHGGVGETTANRIRSGSLLHVSDSECVYGLADIAHSYRAKTSYDFGELPLAGYQLHGHRNGAPGETPVAPIRPGIGGPVICLESGASQGGNISVASLAHLPDIDTPAALSLYPDGVDAKTAKRNRIEPWKRKKDIDPSDATDLLLAMNSSDHVRVRPVPGLEDISACNFTRLAFQQGAWDDITIHARGLFINTATNKVAARGYEKFFHLDESPGRSRSDWLDAGATAYPVQLRKKYNGYLALAASINGKLAVFSKSGATDYSKCASELLESQIGTNGIDRLSGMLERTNTTAVFEVLVENDSHPIRESGPDRLVLLDCIRNQPEFRTDDSIKNGITKRFGFEVASPIATASGPGGLEELLAEAAQRQDEGVVLVDANGYRSKVKTEKYTARKSARTALNRVWTGKSDTLGQRFAGLEDRLRDAGIWQRLQDYGVTGVGGQERLDLARVFDDLDEFEGV